MPKVYFMSYARPRGLSSSDLWEDRFEQDLAEQVATLVPGEGPVGFRDSRSLEAGTASWSEELEKQLRTYPIGIVLLSPAYLEQDRPWCKWECLYLAERNRVVSQNSDKPPRLLLVLEWIKPDDKDLPRDFPSIAQRVGLSIVAEATDGADAVRFVLAHGVRHTIELVDSGDTQARPAYTRFLHTLAAYIVAQWRRLNELGESTLQSLPVPPAFNAQDLWSCANPTSSVGLVKPRPDRGRRRKVYVVYLAAPPGEVSGSRAWRYQEDGEYDWRPFASGCPEEKVGNGTTPTTEERHVSDFVKDIVGVEVIPWQFDYFHEHMDEALATAGQRYPVLFIVDPWTTCHLEPYRLTLEQCAGKDQDFFSTPIVIWNDQDAESVGIRPEFEKRVGTLFNRNRWEPVASDSEFTEVLNNSIKSLQRRIRNILADGVARVEAGPPLISAAPAQ